MLLQLHRPPWNFLKHTMVFAFICCSLCPETLSLENCVAHSLHFRSMLKCCLQEGISWPPYMTNLEHSFLCTPTPARALIFLTALITTWYSVYFSLLLAFFHKSQCHGGRDFFLFCLLLSVHGILQCSISICWLKEEWMNSKIFFLKILFLNNLYTQHGARIYKRVACSTDWARHSSNIFLKVPSIS